jgi:AMP deaminase
MATSKVKDNLASAQQLDLALNSTAQLTSLSTSHVSDAELEAKQHIRNARTLRQKYAFLPAELDSARASSACLVEALSSQCLTYRQNSQGIFEVFGSPSSGGTDAANETLPNLIPVHDLDTFIRDYEQCKSIVESKIVRSLCSFRLGTLEKHFDLHMHFKNGAESLANKKNDRDFYEVAKVDTHIHMTAAVAPSDFSDFIRDKIRNFASEVVLNGKTLDYYCTSAGLVADTVNSDSLNVQGDVTLFDRFDLFNAKYDPAGSEDLKTIFLSFKNDVKGRYLAELMKVAHRRLTETKTSFAEWRVSIKGSSKEEWNALANFILDHNLEQLEHNKWMIQQPRTFGIMRQSNKVDSFGKTLENFFDPLFAVTVDPASNPKLHLLLRHISGFDSVDDESISDPPLENIPPHSWTEALNPGYAYQLYHFWANLTVLNKLREAKGMNTFAFRPHCGESGDVMHLLTAYMLTNGIAHGVNLAENSVLQYLFYLDQIGVHVSPSSNNFLFLKLKDSPFFTFFKRGLNVSLSTDDPMIFHMTPHPLMEEYSICRIFWSMSTTDISELARNSVLQSGFTRDWKVKWLGETYWMSNQVEANDPVKSNVPMERVIFRHDRLSGEFDYLK